MEIKSKVCKKCGIDKILTDYSPDKRASDGRQGRCRSCCTAAHKERYWKDPEKARAQKRNDRVVNPEKYKQYSKASRERNADKVAARKKEYYKKKRKDPVWQAEQAWKYAQKRQERLAYLREYSERNSESIVARARQWKIDNPERAAASARNSAAKRNKAISDGIDVETFAEWTSAQIKECYWCGVSCGEGFHVDHYVPLIRGGKHALDNLVISCAPCNLKKNAKDPIEFAKTLGRLF